MREYKDGLIVVGENAQENTELIRSADDDFIWLHLKSFPSPHVVIRSRQPDAETLHEAAKLCLSRSKYRNLRNIKVMYTTISNIEPTEVIGEVCFRSNKRCKVMQL